MTNKTPTNGREEVMEKLEMLIKSAYLEGAYYKDAKRMDLMTAYGRDVTEFIEDLYKENEELKEKLSIYTSNDYI